ncbi:Auxin Efflux Carrier [Methylobacterium sp. 4-46]|uniref:AEC family transporter n=1 Tax=unclassified Methylobacterium TaxID=2615210 RepID=UPI000152E333|nr:MULTISPECIES: AEC family transporter [Methylobacterium]ACA16389.1 Auxin Efflux Carrier [Methylobacterium sp. 4-46]WFT82100.1 AEC family transporter [Methylobacterium nodulans]
MQAVLNAALPIFALILTGFLCGRTALFGPAATDSLNRFAIYLALPALIFGAMAKITPEQVAQVGFSVAFLGGIVAAFAAAYILGILRGAGMAQACIEGLDAGYSNVGFMGIPLCLLVFGSASLPAAVIATLFTACVLFLFAVVLIELDLQKGAGRAGTARKVVLALVRNPLLIAPLAGLAVGLTGVSVPAPVERFASLLGGAASPCALICIGLFLAQERVVLADVRPIAALVGLKLLLQPAVTALLVFHVFEMPSLWARAAVLLSALPIGSGPFTLAKLYGLEAGVTSGAILLSHIASVLTVSLLVAWLA